MTKSLEKKKARELRNRKNYVERWPDRVRATLVKRLYGIVWDDYMRMYNDQNGSCAICKIPISAHPMPNQPRKVAHVDHCHETGKVRGLLCDNCNKGIGLLKDNSTLCRLAAEYLDKGESFDQE